jgi:D-alanyl-D-alanine carboxypeptidase
MRLASSRPRRIAASGVLALALTSTAAHAQVPVSKDAPVGKATVTARVDSLARAFLADGQAPAVSIAVVRGRDTLVLRGYGVADLAKRTPATAATVYQIGSVTKQFTSSLVMRLVERGTVSVDDSIGAHLRNLPAAWRGITVRQLLNHTSGIPSYTNAGQRWLSRVAEHMPPDSIIAVTASDTMDFAPGARYSYNNTGYVLLGMLVERKYGRPYADLVRTELTAPLGMRATRYCGNADTTAATIARGYATSDTAPIQRAQFLHMSQPYAAGAMCSTVGDLARWNQALATGRVVKAASYKAMTSPEGAAAPRRYGFGLGVNTLEGHAMVTHGGGIFGFISANAYFPDDSLSVTVLANGAPSNPDQLLNAVARVALGLPDVPARPVTAASSPSSSATPATLTAADRARYVGAYEVVVPNGRIVIRIVEKDGRLMAEPEGQAASALVAQGDHVFVPEADSAIRIAFTVEGERATKLAITQNGRTMEGVRVP